MVFLIELGQQARDALVQTISDLWKERERSTEEEEKEEEGEKN